MSQFKRGFKNGVKKQGSQPPKKDGFFGTSFLQSDKSKRRTDAYEKGYGKGDRARKSSMNFIQKLFD